MIHQKKEIIIFYVFSGNYSYGGSLMRCASIYEAFSKNKEYESYLFVNKKLKESLIKQEIIKNDNNVIDIPIFNLLYFEKLNSLLSIIWLAFNIRKLKPNNIFSFQTLNLYSFLINSINFSSYKVVAEVDQSFHRRIKNKFKYLFFLLSTFSSDRVDCLSDQIFQTAKKSYHASLISNINSPKFSISPNSFNPLLRNLFVPLPFKDRKIDILFCGALNELKGAELLLRALKNIYKIGIEPITYFIGDGPSRINIIRAIKNNEISSSTKCFSYHDPQLFMRDTKFFCSLQYVDNYPSQSLIQAMQSGCLALATDVGSTRKLLNDKNSFLIANDYLQLSNKLQILFNQDIKEFVYFQNQSILKINSWAIKNNFIKYYQEIILDKKI